MWRRRACWAPARRDPKLQWPLGGSQFTRRRDEEIQQELVAAGLEAAGGLLPRLTAHGKASGERIADPVAAHRRPHQEQEDGRCRQTVSGPIQRDRSAGDGPRPHCQIAAVAQVLKQRTEYLRLVLAVAVNHRHMLLGNLLDGRSEWRSPSRAARPRRRERGRNGAPGHALPLRCRRASRCRADIRAARWRAAPAPPKKARWPPLRSARERGSLPLPACESRRGAIRLYSDSAYFASVRW